MTPEGLHTVARPPRPRAGNGLRVLWFNLATDLDDPALGFGSRWISEVASRVDRVEVITMLAGRIELPADVRVHSLGKELGSSEPRRLARFYRALGSCLRELRPNVCFVHMAPIFSVLAAPVLVPNRVPIITWHAHPEVTPTVRVAHAVSRRMVASTPEGYGYRHDKLTVLGQGIDGRLFAPGDPPATSPYQLVSVGRLSPVKDPLTLARATGVLRRRGIDARLTLVGGPPAGQENWGFDERLQADVRRLGLDDCVKFAGPVPNHEAVAWHQSAFAHVNAGPAAGAMDKAVLEALACGRPSLTSIQTFRTTMGDRADDLLFVEGDAENLADKVEALVAMPRSEQQKMSRGVRERTLDFHSLDSFIDRLVQVFRDEVAR